MFMRLSPKLYCQFGFGFLLMLCCLRSCSRAQAAEETAKTLRELQAHGSNWTVHMDASPRTPATSSPAAITPFFFGMTVNNIPAAPWPTTLGFQFSGFRSLGVEVKWSDLEPSCDGGSDPTNSCYTWTNFDYWINQALSTGQDVLYVAYWTPAWASSNPADPNCDHGFFTAGGCDPPNDLNKDGTGTDQHLIDFVTAVMTHVGAGKIKYWGLWNEPNIQVEWKGTTAQLLRMAKDIRNTVLSFDSNALFLTPSFVGPSGATSLKNYLAAGGGPYADIIGYHGYVVSGTCPNDCPVPENEIPLVGSIRTIMATYGQQSKPLFDVEGSWGIYNGADTVTDPDQQAAFTGRFYLMHLSEAVDRFYWFSWNATVNGDFYNTNTQQVIPAGIAYQQIYNWTVGATLTAPCSDVGTSWSCSFTRTGSYVAEALWNSDLSLICSNGVCPTQNVAVPTHYTQYRDLAGNTVAITNQSVPVGSKPVLVEGSTPDISINKTASNGNPVPGTSLNYSIALRNNTANVISPVTVSDTLDPSLTLQSCTTTGSGSCQVSGNNVTVTYSTMAASENDTITLAVTVSSSASAPIVNTATANWTNASGNAATNWSTLQVVVGTPKAKLNTTSLTFPNQIVNTTSAPQTVTITSIGTGNLYIYNAGTSGANSVDYNSSSTPPPPITLAPGQATNINVTFRPSATGTRTAALLISDNTAGGMENVSLSGVGVPTPVSLLSSANPSLVGQSVTFTATVTGSGTTPTGTVTFMDGSTTLATVALNSSGGAAYSTSALSAGSHNIVASYSGDSTYGVGSAPLNQYVEWATTTTLQSSLNPSTYGQQVTFTATVSSSSGSAATGSVTFDDGSNVLGTVQLNSSGVASLTTSSTSLNAGSHSITAMYGGSDSYMGSTSTPLTQLVQPGTTTTALTSSLNPASVGQNVIFTANVTGAGATPTGTVTFQNGSFTLATVPLNSSGSAAYATSTLTVGSHNITASYSGDSNYGTSSALLTETIEKWSTKTSLQSSLNPSTYGQSLTFTATVTSSSGNVVSGSVTFYNGSKALGTTALNSSGVSSFTTSRQALIAGSHAIKAVYGGSATYKSSTSPHLNQVINAEPTTTSLSSSPDPSSVGQMVTFTAVVKTAVGTPTGTVVFQDGSNSIGTATLDSSGTAQLGTSSLAAGQHSITAQYGGSNNYAASTSAVLTQTVQ
jgi:uncharacterized repeat protein (TIGR01451 family)